MITDASKNENTVQPVIGLCFHSSAVKDVDHEALWRSLSYVHAPNFSVTDCDVYVDGALVDGRHTARLRAEGRVGGCLSRCH